MDLREEKTGPRQRQAPWIISLADLLTLLLCFFVAVLALQGPKLAKANQGLSLVSEVCLQQILTKTASGTLFAATKQEATSTPDSSWADESCRSFIEALSQPAKIVKEISVLPCGFEAGNEAKAAQLVEGAEKVFSYARLSSVTYRVWAPQTACSAEVEEGGLEVRIRR